jgi:hypothetical protein
MVLEFAWIGEPSAEVIRHLVNLLLNASLISYLLVQEKLGNGLARPGQHLGLDLDVISVGLRAWRLPPLAPQIPQIAADISDSQRGPDRAGSRHLAAGITPSASILPM